jgi:hypothetical protein
MHDRWGNRTGAIAASAAGRSAPDQHSGTGPRLIFTLRTANSGEYKMPATPTDINIVQRAAEITAAENTSLIYWDHGQSANEGEKPGSHALANDCWSANTMYEHTLSGFAGLQPDKTLWTAEQNNILAQLLANAVAAQAKLDAILGVSTQEHVRVNNNLAASTASLLASLP